jgi:hypothetical protein
VYVTPFPDSSGRYLVSTAGGTHPFWSRQGDRIFYSPPGTGFVTVDVTTEPEFRAGAPRKLFDVPYPQLPGRDFDVTPDGQRFVTVVGTEESDQQQINVVVNWLEELKARVPVE